MIGCFWFRIFYILIFHLDSRAILYFLRYRSLFDYRRDYLEDRVDPR